MGKCRYCKNFILTNKTRNHNFGFCSVKVGKGNKLDDEQLRQGIHECKGKFEARGDLSS